MEEGYRQFVQQMADWYAEGLLDTDFATVDKSTVQAKFANSEIRTGESADWKDPKLCVGE